MSFLAVSVTQYGNRFEKVLARRVPEWCTRDRMPAAAD